MAFRLDKGETSVITAIYVHVVQLYYTANLHFLEYS